MVGEIPRDAWLLYIRMMQNDVGVTEPATRIEIENSLSTKDLHEPLEIVLQSMLTHGLVEKRIQPIADSSTKRTRLIEVYQASLVSVEARI